MAVAYVGGATGGVNSGNSFAVTYTSTNGNTLVMGGLAFSSAPTVQDSNGTNWIVVSDSVWWLAYLVNSPAITSVTVTITGGPYNGAAALAEYSGVTNVSSIVIGSASATPATITKTITAGNFLVGCGGINGSLNTAAPTWTANTGSLRQHSAMFGNGAVGGSSAALVDNNGSGSVTSSANWSVSAGSFQGEFLGIEIGAVPPTITSVTPNSGTTSGGTIITNIAGSNFLGTTGVTFGGSAATHLVVVSDTKLTCVTPAHALGAVTVAATSAGGTGSLGSAYTYTSPVAPTITNITPSGNYLGGDTIEIDGTGFLFGSTVTIGGASATAVTVNSGTVLHCTTPAGTPGTRTVTVTTADGTATTYNDFTYLNWARNTLPNIIRMATQASNHTGGATPLLTQVSFVSPDISWTEGSVIGYSYSVGFGSVSDSFGNTYSTISQVDGWGNILTVFYALDINLPPAGGTLTVNVFGSPSFNFVSASIFTGVKTASAVRTSEKAALPGMSSMQFSSVTANSPIAGQATYTATPIGSWTPGLGVGEYVAVIGANTPNEGIFTCISATANQMVLGNASAVNQSSLPNAYAHVMTSSGAMTTALPAITPRYGEMLFCAFGTEGAVTENPSLYPSAWYMCQPATGFIPGFVSQQSGLFLSTCMAEVFDTQNLALWATPGSPAPQSPGSQPYWVPGSGAGAGIAVIFSPYPAPSMLQFGQGF